MLITFKSLSGKVLAFEVEETDTILSLKLKIQEREGIPAEKQRLYYSGKPLLDDHTFADFDIRSDTEIMFAVACLR